MNQRLHEMKADKSMAAILWQGPSGRPRLQALPTSPIQGTPHLVPWLQHLWVDHAVNILGDLGRDQGHVSFLESSHCSWLPSLLEMSKQQCEQVVMLVERDDLRPRHENPIEERMVMLLAAVLIFSAQAPLSAFV